MDESSAIKTKPKKRTAPKKSPPTPAKRKRGGSEPTIDFKKVFKWYFFEGVAPGDIAKRQNVTPGAISHALRPYKELLINKDLVKNHEHNRQNKLTIIESLLTQNLINPEKLKDASLNNIAYAFRQVFDAGRLERGQSTANLSLFHHIIESAADDWQRELKEAEGNEQAEDE